jgi:hypothetical protein
MLQVRELLLRGCIGTAKALAAPFGNRMQRRVLQKLRAAPFGPGVWSVAQPRMEFFNEPRLADPRFADDQHQLAVALPRAIPASHQHP